MRNAAFIVAALCVIAAGTSGARAQSLDIPWSSIDAGGILLAEGGGYEISGTIGQPDAGDGEMIGGGYELVGGFWNVEVAFPCIGDIGGDRDVDLSDLSVLLSHFGLASGATFADGDLDGDGDVDLSDLSTVLSVFGSSCP